VRQPEEIRSRMATIPAPSPGLLEESGWPAFTSGVNGRGARSWFLGVLTSAVASIRSITSDTSHTPRGAA
jgi:hypothetical protein